MYIPVNKRTVFSDLREHVIEIVFDKLNGERRVLRGTLMGRYLPDNTDMSTITLENDVAGQEGEQAMTVWDVQNKGWRSFRTDRVLSMQMLMSY